MKITRRAILIPIRLFPNVNEHTLADVLLTKLRYAYCAVIKRFANLDMIYGIVYLWSCPRIM